MKYYTNNAWKQTVNEDVKNDIQVILGDDKRTPFQPQAKLTRWDNEVNFSMRLQGLPEDNRNSIKVGAGVMTYGDEVKQMRTYQKNYKDSPAWEFEWIYNTHPGYYTEVLTLQMKNVTPYLQPPLYDEIEPGLGETVTATHHYDAEGNILAHRPEEIVGGYCLYADNRSWNVNSPYESRSKWIQVAIDVMDGKKNENPAKWVIDNFKSPTKQELEYELAKQQEYMGLDSRKYHNYYTGKFAEVPAPILTDANGKTAKCGLLIDRETNLMTVTLPKKFMDEAAYPVVVDPEFGYLGEGGSSEGASPLGSDFWWRTNGTAPEDGTVTGISAYMDEYYTTGTRFFISGIYDSSGNKLQQTDRTSYTADGGLHWHTADLNTTQAITNGTTYRLIITDESSVDAIRYDTGGSSTGSYYKGNLGITDPLPATEPTGGTDRTTYKYSIYATYTATGGGSSFTSKNNTII